MPPKKQFSNGRGVKRHMAPSKTRQVKKNRRGENNVAVSSPSPSSSDAEEQFSDVSEGVVYKEPSVYDSLLTSLGSSNVSLADANKRRQRQEEGQSDTDDEDEDEDEIEESESIGSSDGEDDVGDVEAGKRLETDGKEPDLITTENQREDASVENDSDASDSDPDQDLGVDGQSTSQTSLYTSTFSDHLGHKLSKEETENLLKGNQTNKWEAPALGIPNCKWEGTGDCFLNDRDIISSYELKPKLYKHWLDTYKISGGKDFHSSKRRQFFSLFNGYRDILHSNKKPFYHKGLEEDSSFMEAYLMHSLNHVFRTRDLVKKNEAKMAKLQADEKEDILSNHAFLDQGFTRPKVLILLPLKSVAFRAVKRLIQLTPKTQKVSVEHIERFYDDFGAGVEADDGAAMVSQNTSEVEDVTSNKSSKPADFQTLFGGNNDDDFMIGIKFTRKSIRLYADFYSADIIIASPVKLQMTIGRVEEEMERDVDYLSSIEVLIIDHADVISMQNWSFLTSVVKQLNGIPSKQHGSDIMRIRPWYLDGHAQLYRQTIVLSYYLTPEMNLLFNKHCKNYKGKVKLVCEQKGVLQKVLLQVRQIYERFDPDSITDADDARFEYFTKKVFPKLKDSIQGGIMIFIHSYFEFVRLRNFLKSQQASFCLLGDYQKPSDISRSRVRFFEGTRKMMLYTERAYFYKRYKIRGIQNLIIYSLPERKEFYPEIVNMLEGSHETSCTVMFSRFDKLRLERIVGSTSAKRMINSDKKVFVFC